MTVKPNFIIFPKKGSLYKKRYIEPKNCLTRSANLFERFVPYGKHFIKYKD